MKRCSNCFQEKPLTEFYPKRDGYGDGHQARCKRCGAEIQAGYRERKRRGETKAYRPREKPGGSV